MIAGSLDNGALDVEHTPVLTKVAPPLGDVVHSLQAEVRRLQSTLANQAEESHLQRNAITSLTARIYALEVAAK